MPGERILVVDDDPQIARLCIRILEREGYAVQVVTRGQEAIDLLEKERFDLMVVDLKMPGVDGALVLGRGKQLDPDLTVIVMTGYATLDSAVEAMHAGAREFVVKPFGPVELTSTVEKLLEERRRR